MSGSNWRDGNEAYWVGVAEGGPPEGQGEERKP